MGEERSPIPTGNRARDFPDAPRRRTHPIDSNRRTKVLLASSLEQEMEKTQKARERTRIGRTPRAPPASLSMVQFQHGQRGLNLAGQQPSTHRARAIVDLASVRRHTFPLLDMTSDLIEHFGGPRHESRPENSSRCSDHSPRSARDGSIGRGRSRASRWGRTTAGAGPRSRQSSPSTPRYRTHKGSSIASSTVTAGRAAIIGPRWISSRSTSIRSRRAT